MRFLGARYLLMIDEDLATVAAAIDYRIAKWAEEMKPFLTILKENQDNFHLRLKQLEEMHDISTKEK
jgi:hypothetical protein